MADVEKRLRALKADLERARREKAVAEAALASAEEREAAAVKAVVDAGQTPEGIETWLADAESRLAAELEEVEAGARRAEAGEAVPAPEPEGFEDQEDGERCEADDGLDTLLGG
jgi:predicted  nucleic acid-binding Zn-ribbon protein